MTLHTKKEWQVRCADCLQSSDGVAHLGPQIGGDVPSSCDLTECGAGIPAADEVNALNGAPIDLRDVTKVRDARPMLRQHCRGERVDFRLPRDVPPRTFKTEIQATNPAEKRPGGGVWTSHASQSSHRVTSRTYVQSSPSHLPSTVQWNSPNFGLRVYVVSLRPRFVLLENVAAHLGRGFPAVLADLYELGFDAEWATLTACAFGASHTRRRLFAVAYSDRDCEPVLTVDEEMAGMRPLTDDRWHWGLPTADDVRADDGLPHRLDRLEALGNAVVPQVAEWIGRQLLAALPARSDVQS